MYKDKIMIKFNMDAKEIKVVMGGSDIKVYKKA
jgi:hypothetical protein